MRYKLSPIVRLALAGLMLVAVAQPAPATADATMLHAADGAVLDRNGARVLLRCLNLSPWLVPEGYLMGEGSFAALTTSTSEIKQRLVAIVGPEKAQAFWRDWTDAFVGAADFERLKSQGFNCVRLPLNAKFIASSIGADSVVFDPAGIGPMDAAVAWGESSGIHVFLDLHDAPGGQNPQPSVSDVPSTDRVPRLFKGPLAAENQRKTVSLWRALAARYAKADGVGGYDLLNEPELPAGSPSTELAGLYEATIAAIRTVDRSHMIVIEGDHYAHDFSALRSLSDANLMYEFHEYTLFNGAWRTPSQKALVPMLELRSSTKRPLWLGEVRRGVPRLAEPHGGSDERPTISAGPYGPGNASIFATATRSRRRSKRRRHGRSYPVISWVAGLRTGRRQLRRRRRWRRCWKPRAPCTAAKTLASSKCCREIDDF